MASVNEWAGEDRVDPAAPLIELPLYRRENGLWAHQKTFIKLAFEAHRQSGARFVGRPGRAGKDGAAWSGRRASWPFTAISRFSF